MKRLINNGYDFVFVQAAGNNNIDAIYGGLMCAIEDEEINEKILIVGNIKNKVSWLGSGKHKGYDKNAYSNYGNRVEILAPGTNIFSTYTEYDVFIKETISDTYDYSTGTSMSAPHVAGVAAMIWAVNPDLTGKQVKNIIDKIKYNQNDCKYEFDKLEMIVTWAKIKPDRN
jgi:subtilisin family serine protease